MGAIGFTGGVGIADNWTGSAQDPEHWRDNHYRIEGPAVAQMQAAFMDNWTKAERKRIARRPLLSFTMVGRADVRAGLPELEPGRTESMHLMYLLSIAAATKTIDLAMAYFVPDEVTSEALIGCDEARCAGAADPSGQEYRRRLRAQCVARQLGAVVAGGGLIYEYQPTMYHVKLLVVDGLWSSVGSTNFDARSFRLNDEANLNVYDADFARVQAETFEADLKHVRRITYEQWEARPWHEKLKERGAALFSSQL